MIDASGFGSNATDEGALHSPVAQSFGSPAVPAFRKEHKRYSDPIPATETMRVVRTYYRDILRQQLIRLREYALVSMLTGYLG